ncbi:MAG TPA: FG-GAP-like repeat-containing protein, partial [Tepidisphaeraceae bacterium]|nr:FG-GAP-like repeat-containing protein [Tepidisphaeraceae bacterium]
ITGDFNKDGKIDIAASNNGSNDVAIYLGKGNGQFNNPVFYPVGMAVRGIASGDFNKDGNVDLVTANKDDGTVSVLLGNSNGTFKTQKTYFAGTGAWAVVDVDFNGDGKLDLAVADSASANVQILLGKGDGTFGTATPVPVPFYPMAIRTLDVNNDGKADLVTANQLSGNVSVLLGKGNGTFNSPLNTTVGSSPDSLAFGDFNNDGKKDLAVTDFQDDTVTVLLGKGNGTFQTPVPYHAGDTPQGLATADLNKDGKLDLIVSNRSDGVNDPSGNVQVFLGVGDGTFLPPFAFTAHKSPVGTAFADFNGDGRLDLAVANFNSDDVSVLLNATVPITTGNISGSVFSDTNQNGKKDSGETALSGVTIFIDANKNGVQDAGERGVKSDSNGNWSFTGLTAGTYRIRSERGASVIHTLPAGSAAFYDVTVTPGLTAGGKVFGIAMASPSSNLFRSIDAGNTTANAFFDNAGHTWTADTGVSGGTTVSSAFEVANTDDDALYYAYRQGANFTYTISVPNGTYTVDLLFVEPTKTAAGQRKFSVKSQGSTVLSNFDIFAAAGGAKRAVTKSFNAMVTNGKLVLQFIGSMDLALVSAIDVRALS